MVAYTPRSSATLHPVITTPNITFSPILTTLPSISKNTWAINQRLVELRHPMPLRHLLVARTLERVRHLGEGLHLLAQ
jgi:hypothetical protein